MYRMHQMLTLHRVVTQIEAYDGHRTPSALRTVRVLKDLSASEFARLADIDRATVRRLEAGITRPQEKTARKIAAVLGCPAELLFPRDEEARTAEPLNDEDPAGQRGLAPTSAGVGDGHVLPRE